MLAWRSCLMLAPRVRDVNSLSGGTFYIGDLKCVNYLLRISFGKLLLVRSLEKWSRMMELHGIRLLKERRMQPLFPGHAGQTVFWIENQRRHGMMPVNHAPPFHPIARRFRENHRSSEERRIFRPHRTRRTL